ncbi:hypothetical protein JI742_01080 [Piscinibacter sp. Jin2]|uniref:Bacteriocin n=1 Tax=Aquariibacter lacus TaxID=2801332 RepID=A0A9X0XBF9_9BURK|nr:hypothetical protein [Piscinibacter lacus]MBL0718469.1 hypothetical protein [Piscinibacter lacus]
MAIQELNRQEVEQVSGGLLDLGGLLSPVTSLVSGLLGTVTGLLGGLLSTVTGLLGGLLGGIKLG